MASSCRSETTIRVVRETLAMSASSLVGHTIKGDSKLVSTGVPVIKMAKNGRYLTIQLSLRVSTAFVNAFAVTKE